MKAKILLAIALSSLLLAVLACGPLTVTTTPSPLPPTRPSASLTPEPSAVPTDTVPAPTLESFPPAPAHFRPGDPIQLDQIKMTGLTEGWGLSGPYVLVTADGGATWREVTPPTTVSGSEPDQAYGAFLDGQTAWVVFSLENQIPPEAYVWRTTDGGASWVHSAPLLHQAYGDTIWAQFAALDAEHVWLMIFGVYMGAGTHYNNQLLSSADGGLTWIAPFNGDVNWAYTGMAFADANTGWLTWETTGPYEAGPPEYAVTTDSGATWENRELPAPPDAPGLFDEYPYCETYQPSPLPGGSAWVLVGCFDYHYPPEDFVSYLYTSPDGGATWRTVLLPEPVLASQDTLLYFDATHALLLGREIYRSTDGGATWQHLSSVNWDGQFSFVDPQHGWAVVHMDGQAGLVKTVDGGAHWSLIQPVIGE